MKLNNPKKIIVSLIAVLVVVFLGQFIVLNALNKTGPKSDTEKKTITKNPQKWEESWKSAVTAGSQEELEKAEKLLKSSLKEAERQGSKDSRLAAVLNCLAQVYERQGKFSEAEPLYQKVLEIDEKALGKEHAAIINDLDNLAVTYIQQKKYKEAEELFKRAIALDEKLYGKDHPKTAADLSYLVLLYDIQGKSDEAEKQCRRALEINRKAFGDRNPVVAANLYSLALITARSGKAENAEKLLIKAQDIWRTTSSINDPKLALNVDSTIMLKRVFESEYIDGTPDPQVKFPEEAFEKAKQLRKAGKSREAETLLKENLEAARKSQPGQVKLGKYLVRLNNVLFDQKKDGESIIFGIIAAKIFDRQSPEEKKKLDSWNANLHSYLAMAYDRRYHLELARLHYRRAIELCKNSEDVSSRWKALLNKGLKTVNSRIEMEKERVVASNVDEKKVKGNSK